MFNKKILNLHSAAVAHKKPSQSVFSRKLQLVRGCTDFIAIGKYQQIILRVIRFSLPKGAKNIRLLCSIKILAKALDYIK